MIHFACPQCHQRFKVEDKAAGKKTKCPKCGTTISVPLPERPHSTTLAIPATTVPKTRDDDGYPVVNELATTATNDFWDDIIGPPAVPADEGDAALNPASMTYVIVCNHCGVHNSFLLNDEGTTGRCCECDTTLLLPSAKAAAYERKKRAADALAAKKERRRTMIFFSVVAAIFLTPLLLVEGFIFYFECFDPARIAESAASEKANSLGNIFGSGKMFASSKATQILSSKLTADYKVFAVPIETSSKMLDAGANYLDMEYYVVMKGRSVIEVVDSKSVEIEQLCTKYGEK